MQTQLIHSVALNNIPDRKVQEKLASVIGACDVCSKLDKEAGMNGICSKCRVRIEAINRYVLGNLLIDYWDLTMERDWKGDPKILKRYNELVADLNQTYSKGNSIIFVGSHGNGKTMTMINLLKKAAQKGFSVLYTTLGDIVSALTQAEYSEQFLARKELINIDFLCIDEFDSRYWLNEKSGDLYAKMLESIIRVRLNNTLPTFLASNSPNVLEGFSGAMKQSLGSLFKLIETIVVVGEDNRK
jgi:DNA replication protein DnaC